MDHLVDMSDRIEVHSSRALSDLKGAIERFSLRVRDLTEQSGLLAEAARRHCRSLENEAREQVRMAQQACRDASDEDASSAEAELETAKEHLIAIRRTISRVDGALGRLRRRGAAASEAAGRWGLQGTAYLDRKISELGSYYAVSLESADGPQPANPAEKDASSSHAGTPMGPPSMEELDQCILPLGWKWIALDEIDSTLLEGETLEFKDDARQQLIDRFDRLRRDVLPDIDRNYGSTAERLRRDDLRHGIHDTSGKLGAFETFFSLKEPIHLQRRAGATHYSADDGRHRIEIARQLRWPAVPAKVIDA